MTGPARLLAVRLEPGLFAVPLETVEEALGMAEPTPLPNAPRCCLGLLNLRGALIPMLEPMAWLGEELPDRGPDARLLVVRVGARRVAFAVDEVCEVLELGASELRPPDPAVAGIPWLAGSFVSQHDVHVLIKLPLLLAAADAAGLDEAERVWAAASSAQQPEARR